MTNQSRHGVDDMLPFVKIYGERHTSTKFFGRLLADNLANRLLAGVVPRPIDALAGRFDSLGNRHGRSPYPAGERMKDAWFRATFSQNLGWKHVNPRLDLLEGEARSARTVFVTLTKNPYAWLVSMFRRPYHRIEDSAATFPDFVSGPWTPLKREHVPAGHVTPVELWNLKSRSYLRLAERFVAIHICYEEVLWSPNSAIERVIEKIRHHPISTNRPNRRHVHVEIDDRFERYREYYLSERWRDHLGDADVAAVAERLDPDLVRRLGYEWL